jgi:hypothetical protein
MVCHFAARTEGRVALWRGRLVATIPLQNCRTKGGPIMALITPIRSSLIFAPALAVAAILSCAARGQEQQQAQLPQVSDEHKFLHKDVGTWDAVMKIFPQEGAAPVESKGSEKNELLPGGMWLISQFKGEVFGVPFTGVGTIGDEGRVRCGKKDDDVDCRSPRLSHRRSHAIEAHHSLHRRQHAHVRNPFKRRRR